MLEKELEDRMEFIGLTKDLMLIVWHTHSGRFLWPLQFVCSVF